MTTATPIVTPTESLDENQNNVTQQEEENHQEQQQQQQQQQQPQEQNPQSPKSLTLDSPNQQNPQEPPISVEDDDAQDDPDFIPPSSPPITDLHVTTAAATTTAATTTTRRNPPKRKKLPNKRRVAQEKKSKKKLEILVENLKPIPFVPLKTLDFSHHETLLRRLGLWDFVHIDLDRSIRTDLLAQLIATYSPQSRCGYVNGARIMVNRPDLARALRLPVKKDKCNVAAVAAAAAENAAAAAEEKESDESRAFVEEFLSNWVLLHEDMWMMPPEVINWTKVIKEGNLEKVDWAGLIWFMIEKELMAAPQLGDCYYASHLQWLIKCQKADLFMEEPVVVMEVDVKDEEEEENDVKMEPQLLEEHSIELSLGGQENVVAKEESEKECVGNDGDEDGMDFEEGKEEEEEAEEEEEEEEEEERGQRGQWLFEEKGNVGNGIGVYLRRCNQPDVGGVVCEEEMKEEEEGEEVEVEEEEEEEEEGHEEDEEEQDGGFHISLKSDTLERVTSVNLMPAMEDVQIPFGSGVQIRDNSSAEFLASRVDNHTMPGGSPLFGNGNKRVIGHENDVSHNPSNGCNKRLRSHSSWNDRSSDFDMCMEQVHHLMGKARMMYVAKERAYEESSMHQQILINELQVRNNMIEQLQNAKFEEQHRRTVQVRRLESELSIMEKLLDDYRKALRETHKAFSEYRERYVVPGSDEPLYKDVPGSGGLVLSTMELERQRLKQEEEERMNRLLIEENIKTFENEWIGKFEALKDGVHSLGNRLLDVEKEVKLVKELFAKRKNSDASECAAPSEE